jgi:hypothetical protein
MDPLPARETIRVTVTKNSPKRPILRPLMVTSNNLMAVNAPVRSHSARWVTTQLKAVVIYFLCQLTHATTWDEMKYISEYLSQTVVFYNNTTGKTNMKSNSSASHKIVKWSLSFSKQRKTQPIISVHEYLNLSGFAFFHQQLWQLHNTYKLTERSVITSLVAITLDGLKSMACTKNAGMKAWVHNQLYRNIPSANN